jgi:hypothetical protein
MGIEWFRDLSITILGFVTVAVLIFVAILVYRLYRSLKATLSVINAASKIAYDTVKMVQQGVNPLVSILSLIQGIRGGFQGFSKIFKKESE